MSWSIPTQSPTGMTYSLYVIPYDAGCGWDPDNPTVITAGQDATSKVVNMTDMPTSPINYWSIDIYSTTANGDQAHETGIPFTTSGTNPCGP
jgi:hypothetical protein